MEFPAILFMFKCITLYNINTTYIFWKSTYLNIGKRIYWILLLNLSNNDVQFRINNIVKLFNFL